MGSPYKTIAGNLGVAPGDPAALPTVPVITGSGGTLKLPLSSFGAMFTPTFAGGLSWDQALSQSGNIAQGFAPGSPAAAALGGTASGPAGGKFANGAATDAFAYCGVVSGPSYTPSGTINPTIDGFDQHALFNMDAKFANDQTHDPSCCRVHQDISWDQAFQNWSDRPPHQGFPSDATTGNWYEDRTKSGIRFGDRSLPDFESGYTTNGQPDLLHGDTFHDRDDPRGPRTMKGTFDFRLTVTDSCHGDAPVATSPTITIPFGGDIPFETHRRKDEN